MKFFDSDLVQCFIWLFNNLIGVWQGMILSTKLLKIKEKYNISWIINSYAVILTSVSLVGFAGLLIYSLYDCSTTEYMSLSNEKLGSGSNSKTICDDVPKSISNDYYLASSGYWSTETYYLAKDTMFMTTFVDFTSTEEEFDGYMTEFEESLEELNIALTNLTYSNAIKKIITYRNGSWEDPMFTIPYFDVNSIFKPESASLSYFTHCGQSFSPLGSLDLSLVSSGYSYDRAFHVQGATTSDGPIMTFTLTITPTTSAYDMKVDLDGSSDTSLFSESDASDALSVSELFEMDGFVDIFEIKLDTDMCPPGFTGILSSDGLVCSLSFDMNVFATVAAINSGYGDASETLVPDGNYRYTTRNYISSQVIASTNGMYYMSIDGYLFLPDFSHYFADLCETQCSSDDTCSTNDFNLVLTPSGYYFNMTSTSSDSSDLFIADLFYTQCEIFAPLYSGPNTNDDTQECTYDTTYSCYDSWVGDGYCDAANNNDCCEWDGGDCCESTCESTTFSCGEAGYQCCETSDSCSTSCSISDDDCDTYQANTRKLTGKKAPSKREMKNIKQTKATINSYVRKSSYERRQRQRQSMDEVILNKEEKREAIGRNALKAMRQRTAAKPISRSEFNYYETESARDWEDEKGELRNVPIVDSSRKIHATDANERVRKGQMQPMVNMASAIRTDASRRLGVVPDDYTTTSIVGSQLYQASLTNFDSQVTGYDGYGYISLEKRMGPTTEQSYMCYSRAATTTVHLCPALCNRAFSEDLTPYNDDTNMYGGFLASSQTMAHAYDIGSLIEEAVDGKGFVMATGITFDDEETEFYQGVYILGSSATMSTTTASTVDDEFSIGIEHVDSLPCELAACYCYIRETGGVEFTMDINTISTSNYVNPFFFEMDDEAANCANPYSSFTLPESAPVDLLESYYSCTSTICPDFIGAIGSAFANILMILPIVALLFSSLITDFYLPKVKKVAVEDWRKDDGAYEEIILDIIEESVKNRRNSMEMTSISSSEGDISGKGQPEGRSSDKVTARDTYL